MFLNCLLIAGFSLSATENASMHYLFYFLIVSDPESIIEWYDDKRMMNWKICDLSYHLPGGTMGKPQKTCQHGQCLIHKSNCVLSDYKCGWREIWKCIVLVESVEGSGNWCATCFNILFLVVYSWFLMILRKNIDFP